MDKENKCSPSNRGNWAQIRVTVKTPRLDELCAIMSMVEGNLMIEDTSDISSDAVYGELIDESILKKDKTTASASIFIAAEENVDAALEFIYERMAASGIKGKVEVLKVKEDDWANSWKSYYKPQKIGKITVVPSWEEYAAEEGDIVVRMDPGMAFGSGTHETTRLIIELLQVHTKPGCRVLDIGCGSGILAICAALLGAGVCRAYDIDPVAVRVAKENIEINEVGDRVSCAVSNLFDNVSLEGGEYDIISANIVADIIIRMSQVGKYLHAGGVLLASGIIAHRTDEVASALGEYGLYEVERICENDWCAMIFKFRGS